MNKISVGIIGATGYTGGELIRVLLQHSGVKIDFCYSRSKYGKKLSDIHQDIFYSDLEFTNKINSNVNCVFLCLPHGDTKPFLVAHQFSAQTKIIDLSNDFRLKADAGEFVYGLPELNKPAIKKAVKVANPGCFATTIQLALLPLAKDHLLNGEIHISAVTGSTGAGNKLSETSHFSWRNNNMSTYKTLTHQHVGEINESLTQLQPDYNQELLLVPYRGDYPRGIIATSIISTEKSEDEIRALYKDFYKDAAFVRVSDKNINLKQIVNTNYCLIYIEKQGNKLIVVSASDNLLKGASGQAVQNMNLMFGFEETEGLHLKPTGF